MVNRWSWFFLIVLAVMGGCKKNELPPYDYYAFVKSDLSNMNVSKNIGDFEFTLSYEPIDYKIVNILRSKIILKNSYDELFAKMYGMQYYVLKINVINSNEDILTYRINSEGDYQDRLAFFSFGFQNSIFLEENGEVLPCTLFHYERMYDIGSKRNFVLGFEQKDNTLFEDKTLVIDSDFFNSGKIKIKIKGKDIKSLPNLKIN